VKQGTQLIPAAPSWSVIFLFGALWNAVIERSVWASLSCGAVAVALFLGEMIRSRK
jgi:hypothetical protein